MRRCRTCGVPIDRYRRQAVYCGGPCRAAASRARAAAAEEPPGPRVGHGGPSESAQNRTRELTEAVPWTVATAAEEALVERVWREYADLWETA